MRRIAALILLLGLAGRCCAAASCTATAPAMSFGAYAPLATSSPIQTLGSVSVSCSRAFGDLDTVVNYTAVIGAGSSGGFATRTLRSGVSILNYQLYQTASMASPWLASGVSGSLSLPLFGTRTQTNTHAVFGQIAPRQTAARPGAYSDTLVFTVTYD